MSFHISGKELRRALKDIEAAEAQGFMYCWACLDAEAVDGIWVRLRYSDLHERAHPTDANLDWGRFQAVHRDHRFDQRTGKLVRLKA